MFIQDVARDGRLLIMRDDLRASIAPSFPANLRNANSPGSTSRYTGYLSHDGKFLVFGDESRSVALTMRSRCAMSETRASSALGKVPSSPRRLTTSGPPRSCPRPANSSSIRRGRRHGELNRGALEHVRKNLQRLLDGRRVLICGNEAGKAARCYEQDVTVGAEGGDAEGTEAALLAADGRTLLLRTSADAYQVTTIGGGPPADMMGLTPADFPFSWTRIAGASSSSRASRPFPHRTRRRGNWRPDADQELAPPDRAGVNASRPANGSRTAGATCIRFP